MNFTARKRSQFAICLIFIMIFTSFTGLASATEQVNLADLSLKETMKQAAQQKIDAEVLQTLEQNEYVDILIKLTEQVDTTLVAQEAKQQLSAQATPFQEKMQARFAIVEALSSTAKQSQQGILEYLEQAQDKGAAKDINSFFIVNMISAKVSKEIVEELSYRSDVQLILPDAIIPLELPERSVSLQQEATTQGVEWNIERIGAPSVWNTYGVDGTGVVVGMIDTGAHWQHEALKEKWRGYNPADPNNPNPVGNWFDAISGQSLPYDIAEAPHGSHVMGTILGQDPAGQNVIGVAPGAKWIAARAFTAAGGSSSNILASAQYLLAPINENGQADPSLAPDVINNSWGGGRGIDEWFRPMVQAWRDANILPVFAAGNTSGGSSPGSVSTPANYPESFAVGATDIQNKRGSFSNQGPGPYPEDLKPDVAAPGVNIRSSVINGYEGGWNGTSMAAPHAVGTAALLLSLDSSLSVDELEEIMMDTATPLTDDQYPESPNFGYGHGLINAFDAVSSIASGRGVITGSVVQEGSDHEPATITHDPVDLAFSGLDIPLEATISDNISVARAELWVKQESTPYWVVIPMNRKSGDYKNGVWGATIPWMFVNEPGFTYQIKAVDYGRNLSETDEFAVNVSFGIKPDEYDQDFSEYPIGWQLGGDWEWGRPTVGPTPLTGDKLVATNLTGNYSSRSDSQLLLPPFDLRNAEEASFRFNHWYDTELNYDQGVVAVSNDYGENWDIVLNVTGRDQQWRSFVLDLNEYAGSETPVFVVFAFTSDGSVNYPGWYVDYVELKGVDEDPPTAPTNLEGIASSAGVRLSWAVSPDPDVSGYHIYRKSGDQDFEAVGQSSSTQYLDSDVEGGTTYTYAVAAYDYSGNVSELSNEVTVDAPRTAVIYASDFENDNGGFTADGTNSSWEWGVPTSGPGHAASGEKLWATNLSGNYSNSSNSYIESPVIDLSGYESAELTFTHWFTIENNYDKAFVRVSADGGSTWTDLAMYTNRIGLWDTPSLSLDEFLGQEILIRFAFTSDSSVSYPGWYVDDVYVYGLLSDGEDNLSIGIMPIDKPESKAVIAKQDSVSLKDGAEAPVKPEELLQGFKLQEEAASYTYVISENKEELELQLMRSGGLPVDAVVTVLETGRSVRTNPADGTYRMIHPATPEGESWTLQVESYGFYTETEAFQLQDEQTLVKNFVLEPMPKGTIQGQVINERNGEPIAGAIIQLVEDRQIAPTESQEDGSFVITNVLEGSYTLKVSASNYEGNTAEVTVTGGETAEVTVSLKPFIGYEHEIAYDDGTAENARAFYDEGNGWAMRMTPDGLAQIKGASVYLWGSDWPVPGANAFSVAVYDHAGQEVISPVVVEGERGGWNYVDLSEYGFATDQDFYLVMVQIGNNPMTPGIGMDENGPFADRSYMVIGGSFQKLDSSYGNIMIRANVAYSLDAPVLESPADQTYTNEESIEVRGTVQMDSLVSIYVNGELAATTQAQNGQFAVEVDLVEGDNVINATAKIDAGETDPSASIIVIKDTQLPELTILSPEDGSVTNREVITVEGVALDVNLDRVLVNGEAVQVNEAGEFSKRLIVEQGENVINVQALDLAGNEATQSITVYVNQQAPDITDLQPATDQALRAGDTLEVSFRSSAEGGQASFSISVPLGNELASNRIKMTEVEPGYYVGTWTVPAGLVINGASIEVELIDSAGNRATAIAEGKISINPRSKELDPYLPKNPNDLSMNEEDFSTN